MNILITEDEIKNNPNYYELGKLVSRKYWEVKNSEDNYDVCVVCGKKTPYRSSQDISNRIGYIEGAGQGCYNPIKCNE
jgi:hypothetical protein